MTVNERLARLEQEYEQTAREVTLLREELAVRQAEEQLRALIRHYACVLRQITHARQHSSAATIRSPSHEIQRRRSPLR